MPRPSGLPKTGGRAKGVKNKRTVERMHAVSEMINNLGGEMFSGDAHAFLVGIYKNMSAPLDLRLDAARIAIRYEIPSLTSVSLNADVNIGTRAERIKAARARSAAGIAN